MASITSDHYPVIATIGIKLKANKQGKGPGRNKFQESTQEQMSERNANLLTRFKELAAGHTDLHTMTDSINQILEEGTKELPTIPKQKKEEAYSEDTRQLLKQ